MKNMQMHGLYTPESPDKTMGTQTLTGNRARFKNRKDTITDATNTKKEMRHLY